MARFGRRTPANPKRPSVRALSVGDSRTPVSSATELRHAPYPPLGTSSDGVSQLSVFVSLRRSRRCRPCHRRPEYGVADPWGHDPWVPPVSASVGVDLGGSSVFRRFFLNKGFQNSFKSCLFHNLSSTAPKFVK